ncbi:MAG: hypothetical protein WAW11_03785 [Patescibacteria group bacterium]
MNKKANKKNIARRFLVAGFFVLLAFFSLLDSSPANAVVNDYYKNSTSTLTAVEWNNLLLDFLNTGGGRINGSVGINTATSSSYILNVSGGGYFSQPVVVGTPTDVSHAATMGYINSVITGGSGSTVGYWVMNGTNINNTNAGNVGIGTTAPERKLHVLGSGEIFANSGGAHETLLGDMAYAYFGLYTPASPTYLSVRTGTTDIAAFTNTGNVGIGTTNPGVPLEITSSQQGVLKISRSTASGYIQLGSGTGAASMFQPRILGVEDADGTGNLFGWELVGQVDADLAGKLPAISIDGRNSSSALVNRPIFGVGSYIGGLSDYKLLINANGNVGIGTTNPNSILNIKSAFPEFNIETSSASARGAINFVTSGGNAWRLGSYISTAEDGNFEIVEGAASRLYIKPGGNVGIGNASPGTKLDVTGSFRNSLATTHTLLGSAGNVVVMADNTGTLYSTPLATFVSSNSLDLWEGAKNGNIWNGDAGAGNVGIGRTNPSQKLHVEGVSAAETQLLSYETNAPQIVLNHSSAGWGLIQNNAAGKWSLGYNGTTAFDTLGTSVLTWTNGGNVGIGTTNPTYGKLQIVGGNIIVNRPSNKVDNNAVSEFPAFEINNSFAATQSGYVRAYYPTYNNLLFGADYDGNIGGVPPNIQFGGVSTPRLTIVNNGTGVGNIGIGLTNPGTKLDVAGSLRNSLATTHNLLGAAGNVVVMADNTGTLYSSPIDTFVSSNSLDLWKGTKNGNIWNGDAGAGNVGIGTTNPGHNLAVYSDNGTDMYLGHNNNTGTFPKVSALGFGSGAVSYGYANNGGTLTVTGSAQIAAIQSQSSGAETALAFYTTTGGSVQERMRILNGGNIGVGTTGPSARLNIAGPLGSIVGGGGSSIKMTNTDTSNYSSISAGIVGISNSGMEFSVDGTSRMVINSSGNVGIGTTGPGGNLQIGDSPGSGGTGALFSGFTGVSHGSVKLYAYASNNPTVQICTDSNGGTGSCLTYFNAAAGNVGIGLTNPGTKLDISGSFRNSLATTHSLLGAAGNVVVMADNTGTLYSTPLATFASANSLWGGTKNGNIWNGDAGVGNVGIGTTAPTASLHILKTSDNYSTPAVRITGKSLANTGDDVNGFGLYLSYNLAGNRQFVFADTESGAGTRFASGSIDGFNVLSQTRQDLTIGTETNGVHIASAIGNTQFSVNNVSGTASKIVTEIKGAAGQSGNYLNISSSGGAGDIMSVRSSGNVGIGTTNPGQKLHVAGTGNTYIEVSNGTNNGYFGKISDASTIQSDDDITFRPGSTESMRLLSTGNVGIGITNPGTKLDVAGSFRNSLATTHSLLGAAGNVVVMADNTGTLYSTPLATFTSANSLWGGTKNGNIWNGDAGVGNVGIGVTGPGAKLHINDANYNQFTLKVQSAAANNLNGWGGIGFSGEDANTKGAIIFQSLGTSYSRGNMIFALNNALDQTGASPANAVMTLTPSGSVGIGTTAPSELLHISKSASADDVTAFIENTAYDAGSNTRLLLSTKGTDGNPYQASIVNRQTGSQAGDLIFQTIGNDRVTIQQGGNVGIGTNNPRATLEVGANDGVSASIVAGNIIEVAGQSDVAQAADITVTAGTLVDGGPTAKNGRGYWDIPSFPATITFNTRGWWTYAGMSFTAANVHNFPAGGGNKLPANFLVEASADGVSWSTVENVTGYTSALYYKNSVLGGSGQWIRITATAPQSGETTAKLANVQIFNGQRTGKGPFSLSAEGHAVFLGGNVGVGSIIPGTKLDVSGSSRNSLATTHSLLGAAGNVVVMADNTGTLYSTPLATFTSANSLWGGTKNGNIWNGDAGVGNVGIGTTAPEGKLQINASDDSVAPALALRQSNNIDSGFDFKLDQLVDGKLFIDRMNEGVASNLMTWDRSSGNVGIGTTNPTSLLHLNVASGDNLIKVNTQSSASNWIGMSLTYLNSEYFAIKGNVNSGELRIGGINPSGYYTTIYSNGAQTMSVAAGNVNFPGSGIWNSSGNVGIGTTPNTKLSILGGDDASGAGVLELRTSGGTNLKIGGNTTYSWIQSHSSLPLHINDLGNNVILNLGGGSVGIGITNPGTKLDVSGSLRNSLATTHSLLGAAGNVVVMADNTGTLYSTPLATFASSITGDYLPLAGGSLTGDLNMGGNDILNINKLTVNTIDPLYNIKGTNYSTFAPSIAGGVKEEYTGRADIKAKSSTDGVREYVIDFDTIEVGSDLWVWRHTVDFSDKNVEVLITPYGGFAQVYSSIKDNKIIFKADRAVSVHYRLSGRRVDWKSWPTKALNQTEKAGFVIE